MLELEVTGGRALTLLVASMANWGLDIRSHREPLKRSIQQVIAPAMKESFTSSGRPEWPVLADSTVVRKSSGGFPTMYPLQRTGTLKRVASQLNSWTISTDGASLDKLPGAEYGSYHMAGTKYMPARPFADIDDEQLFSIESIFADWITERAVRAGVF